MKGEYHEENYVKFGAIVGTNGYGIWGRPCPA